MQYTNFQILVAVLNRWLKPVTTQFVEMKMNSFPALKAIENKIRSIGWVIPNWTISKDISSFIEPITNGFVQSLLKNHLPNVLDEAIPSVAHGIVDKALENGKLEFFEGNIVFDKEDLKELKTLLNYNLPYEKIEEYTVLTSPPETKVEEKAKE